MGAIEAIEYIVRVDNININSDVNLNMFGRYLLSVLPPFASDMEIITDGVRAIGLLSARGMGPLTQKFVSLHADKALEWLEHSEFAFQARIYVK